MVLHCSARCGMAVVGVGTAGWVSACFGVLWRWASGLAMLLFGNLVEASVASNETDASQLVERILEANCQKAAC